MKNIILIMSLISLIGCRDTVQDIKVFIPHDGIVQSDEEQNENVRFITLRSDSQKIDFEKIDDYFETWDFLTEWNDTENYTFRILKRDSIHIRVMVGKNQRDGLMWYIIAHIDDSNRYPKTW